VSKGQYYDQMDFPDYLDGTPSYSMSLWRGPAVDFQTARSVVAAQGKHRSKVKVGALDPLLAARYDHLTRTYLGQRTVGAEYPGGRRREAWRLLLEDGSSVIAVRRDNPMRADLEANVLATLALHGAPVPRTLAYSGLILLQEDVGRMRASDVLQKKSTDAAAYRTKMSKLIDSLFAVYEAADAGGLSQRTPVIGRTPEWVTELIDRTALIANHTGVPSPRPDVERMQILFRVFDPEFVKWDARPGNAILRPDGGLCWIDWEHCGARHRLDDLAWLLADETVPSFPAEEMALVEEALPRYANGPLGPYAREYLFTFGVCHMAVRLARILVNKVGVEWDDEHDIRETDQERVRLSDAQRLCQRASRWAREARAVKPLARWFDAVAKALPEIK
jgi:hypothetical protein